ncbi:MAG: endo-1,4-beta-xylanase [Bauldia sp.]
MLDRRKFLGFAPALALFLLDPLAAGDAAGEAAADLRQAARARGVEVGAMVQLRQLNDPPFLDMLRTNFTLAANQLDEMEWASQPGLDDEPSFRALNEFLDFCAKNGLRPRARQIYSHENTPPNAHLRPDGTPKNKAELEQTLLRRVDQVCKPLKGRNAIIQVIDEILADHEGGIRKDPFADVFGEELADILFHAAHEAAPDALLTYQEFGPEIDPDNFFRRKTKDYLALLERLRKRNVPITGAGLGGFIPPGNGFGLRRPVFQAIEDLDYDIHLNELTVIYDICGDTNKWHPASASENDRLVSGYYERTFEFLGAFQAPPRDHVLGSRGRQQHRGNRHALHHPLRESPARNFQHRSDAEAGLCGRGEGAGEGAADGVNGRNTEAAHPSPSPRRKPGSSLLRRQQKHGFRLSPE